MTQNVLLSPLQMAQNYERYLVPALFLPWSEILFEYAKPQTGERVLDIACGTGIVARQLAHRVGEQGHVTAIDLNPAMLETARVAGAVDNVTVDWQEGNALELPFEDHQFDLVTCQQGFQFFPDQLRTLVQMHRVLVPQGRVVISVNASLDLNPAYRLFNEVFSRHMKAPALSVPFSFGDAPKLEALFSEAGFHNIKVDRVALPTRFQTVDRFVQATMLGSAAVVPAFAQLNTAERESLMKSVTEELRDLVSSETAKNHRFDFSVSAIIGRAEA